MTIALRPYGPSDCAAFVRLFRDTVHSVNARDYAPGQLDAWAPADLDLAAWDCSLRAHRTLAAVADGGRIVGFGDLDVGAGYLDRLFVHKDWQGRGVARLLCDALERGIEGPVSTRSSITARPFFEHRGYRVVEEVLAECRGVELACYMMEKPVGQKSSPAPSGSPLDGVRNRRGVELPVSLPPSPSLTRPSGHAGSGRPHRRGSRTHG